MAYLMKLEPTTTALILFRPDHFVEYKDRTLFEVITYSPNCSEENMVSSQLLFGGYPFNNTFQKYSHSHPKGFGLQTVKTRLSYGNTSELIINDQKLVEIDSIVNML